MAKASMSLSELHQCMMLCGPLPVLTTENTEHFQEIFNRVIASLQSRDMIELMFIRDFVYESWHINRLRRHAVVAIERWYHQSEAYQEQRIKLLKARRDERVNKLAERLGQKPADIAELIHLEEKILGGVDDIDNLFERKATEMEHNRALEKSIQFHERLDRLIESATSRRNDALRQLERYRDGWSQLVIEATAQVINEESHGQTAVALEAPSIQAEI